MRKKKRLNQQVSHTTLVLLAPTFSTPLLPPVVLGLLAGGHYMGIKTGKPETHYMYSNGLQSVCNHLMQYTRLLVQYQVS